MLASVLSNRLPSTTAKPATCVLWGHSFFEQHNSQYIDQASVSLNDWLVREGQGWFWHFQYMNRNPFASWTKIDRAKYDNRGGFNLGRSGETAAQILARAPEVIAANPDVVFYDGIFNSISSGTFAAITASIAAAHDVAVNRLRGKRGLFVCFAPTTKDGTKAGGAFTAAQLGLIHQIRSWLRQKATELPNFILIDDTKDVEDPATGTILPAMTRDGVHPNTVFAILRAKRVTAALSGLLTPNPISWNPYATYDATNNPYGNLITTAALAGTGGTLTATGSSGSLATGWTITNLSRTTSLCVLSKTTNSKGFTVQRAVFSVPTTGTTTATWIIQAANITNTPANCKLIAEGSIVSTATLNEQHRGAYVRSQNGSISGSSTSRNISLNTCDSSGVAANGGYYPAGETFDYEHTTDGLPFYAAGQTARFAFVIDIDERISSVTDTVTVDMCVPCLRPVPYEPVYLGY